MYGASEGLSTVLLEPEATGGQAGTSAMIRNYLGFPRGVSGTELAYRAFHQAIGFGADIVYGQRAVGLHAAGSDETVPATALFVLIGAEPRTGWLPPTIRRDRWGFVVTDTDLLSGDGRPPAAVRAIHRYLSHG